MENNKITNTLDSSFNIFNIVFAVVISILWTIINIFAYNMQKQILYIVALFVLVIPMIASMFYFIIRQILLVKNKHKYIITVVTLTSAKFNRFKSLYFDIEIKDKDNILNKRTVAYFNNSVMSNRYVGGYAGKTVKIGYLLNSKKVIIFKNK